MGPAALPKDGASTVSRVLQVPTSKIMPQLSGKAVPTGSVVGDVPKETSLCLFDALARDSRTEILN